MILVWFATVAMAGWFGFELGRKWTAGEEEAELQEHIDRQQGTGFRLNRITVRR